MHTADLTLQFIWTIFVLLVGVPMAWGLFGLLREQWHLWQEESRRGRSHWHL